MRVQITRVSRCTRSIHLYAFLFVIAPFLAFVQNFLAILLSDNNPNFAKFLLLSKEVYMASAIACGGLFLLAHLQKHFKTVFCAIVAIIIVVYILLATLLSSSQNLLSLRQLLIIPLFFLYGCIFALLTKLEYIQRYLVPLFIVVCLSGYLERFLLFDSNERFWQQAGIHNYMLLKGFETWAFGPGGTPGNFFSFDLVALTGKPVRRMVSLFLAEPTLFGQLLLLPLLYSLLSKRWLLVAIFAPALLLSFSKGGILGFMIAFALYYLQYKRNTIVLVILKGLLLFASLTVLIGVLLLGLKGTVNSVLLHTQGLFTNIMGLIAYPLGRGVGSSGNFANLAGTASIEGSGESYLGAIIGQLGFPGLLLYCMFFASILRLRVNQNHYSLPVSIKYAALATLIAGVASESAISYVGSGYLFALLPFLYMSQPYSKSIMIPQSPSDKLT
jgi:hypothetical protein